MAQAKVNTTNLGAKIWWNGEMIPAADATIHITAHSLHYGLAVFEGVRAYDLKDGGIAIFRCDDHMKRFSASEKIAGLPSRYDFKELTEACKVVVRESGMGACYLRPLGFLNSGPLGVAFEPSTHDYTVAILSLKWGKYLGADAVSKGARIKISSFTRQHPNISMTKGKICGQYTNSVFAKMEAKSMGFDEALLLDPEGYVAEGSGENVFVIKNNKVFSPSVESVLNGITRDTVIHILKDLKLELVERRMSRDELYTADEIFFCGTAAEISPIAEIDNRSIGNGKPGELTQEVSKRFFEIVTGANEKYSHWLNRV